MYNSTNLKATCSQQDVNVNLPSALSHSASNALIALNAAETDVSSKAGDVEVWIMQVIAQQVPDCQTNHSKRMTAVYVQLCPWYKD